MDSGRETVGVIFSEGAARTAAARDVVVQAFGAMGAFLENGEASPLAYAVRLYINAAGLNDEPVADVIGTLSQLAQYAMQRCCEDGHQKRYETLTSVIARCVGNCPESPDPAAASGNATAQVSGRDLASEANPVTGYVP